MTTIDVRRVQAVVVGSGIAGLTAALVRGDCVVVSKTATGDGSSRRAQGGIAAAIGADDTPTLHAADTERVSGGLGRRDIAELVTLAAPERIRWLMSLGAEFDTDADGSLTLGREAGHKRRRIVHANGDATGVEVMRALVQATVERPDIERHDHTLALDLLRDGDRVVGVLTWSADRGLIAILANVVVLATGGLGRLYEKTTNPHEVTADGLAMAARAGAAIRDPEFVQFHPTALDASLDPMPLLTEALRGEGAHLLDAAGHRFMVGLHDDAELAPRDVVARENWRRGQDGPVYLDVRMIGRDFSERFPTVWRIAQGAGLDPRFDLLPVSPAQHYHMGGIATDDRGRASLAGLYACGEASSTGLHGANRLASNSLLEGIVFGARVAETMAADATEASHRTRADVPRASLELDMELAGADDPAINELRRVMWERVGLVRDRDGLRAAVSAIEGLAPRLATHPIGRNMLQAARIVTEAALARTESRGSHHRLDHPGLEVPATHTLLHPLPVSSVALAIDREPLRLTA